MERSDFEIMAPAGSREALAAAAQAGADSVYFGVEKLNMRSHAASAFAVADLAGIAAFCRDHGMRSYLTVNTVVYDEDMALVREIIEAAAAARISAVIASDVAVMNCCRANGVEVHLSTQLNISNTEALRFYAQFADVVVLARELSLEQVRAISEAVSREGITGPSGRPVRIEMFCHGALCMAVSGKCYMSLATRGKSANRGECLQSCRRSYVIRDTDRDIEMEVNGGYVLSPKDLKTIGFMDRMVHSGVRVFKIEGRARGPEYVRTVTECYREALEAVLSGAWTDDIRTRWDARLAAVFNRGFWDGYYLGRTTPELAAGYGSAATERKVFLGKCLNYFPKAGVGHFLIQAGELRAGERVMVAGPTTGAVFAEPAEILREGKPVTLAAKGAEVTFRLPEKVRENDKLYAMRRAER